jgi:LAO/AO transport system kinase
LSATINNLNPDFYIQGILNGEMAVLSRSITLVESLNETHQILAQQIIDGVLHKTGKSFRLGITGVPGVGKSTFIESFGKHLISNGHKLAVLAVDPSSTKSKGSILGDKTRMEELSHAKNVYIRPSPSSGTLGGVTRSTYETILLCEAAGYDFILVETVGVGQSEVAVSKLSDFFLLLMLAGAGDELQGIKRGIIEQADALVVTKADGGNLEKAKAARSEYAHAMHLLQASESGWIARTHVCSSITQMGIAEVYTMLMEYKNFVTTNGYFAKKRQQQQLELFLTTLDGQLKKRFFANKDIQKQIKELQEGKNPQLQQPFSLAKKILDNFFGNLG